MKDIQESLKPRLLKGQTLMNKLIEAMFSITLFRCALTLANKSIKTGLSIRLRNKSKEGKKEFIIGFKKDIWDSLISKTTSNRTFNS